MIQIMFSCFNLHVKFTLSLQDSDCIFINDVANIVHPQVKVTSVTFRPHDFAVNSNQWALKSQYISMVVQWHSDEMMVFERKSFMHVSFRYTRAFVCWPSRLEFWLYSLWKQPIKNKKLTSTFSQGFTFSSIVRTVVKLPGYRLCDEIPEMQKKFSVSSHRGLREKIEILKRSVALMLKIFHLEKDQHIYRYN